MLPAAAQSNTLGFALSYCALLVLLGVVLAIRVILIRRKERIGLGSGDNKLLSRRIRAHGNFSEYAPLIILLLIGLALVNAPEWLIHLVGVAGLVGRSLHAIGLEKSAGESFGRVGGMMLTFTALLIGAASLLLLAWR